QLGIRQRVDQVHGDRIAAAASDRQRGRGMGESRGLEGAGGAAQLAAVVPGDAIVLQDGGVGTCGQGGRRAGRGAGVGEGLQAGSAAVAPRPAAESRAGPITLDGPSSVSKMSVVSALSLSKGL